MDPIEGWRDWSDYLGERRAVVVFNVTSDKTGFPFYDADKIQGIDEGSFKDMKIYRDGVEIVPVEKVRITDAAKGGQAFKVPLLAGMVEQMWKDFTAYLFGRR